MKKPDPILTVIARENLHIPTLEARQADSLDFHNLAVWQIEAALNAAFDAGAQSVARNDVADIGVHKLLAERCQVAVIWSIEDVQAVRPKLNEVQSWQVLQQCRRVHDCSIGFHWLLIETVADDLFPDQAND